MSLRSSLSIFMAVVAVVASIAGVSLVLLPTYLHRAALDLEGGLHSIRLAEEMQVDVLTYIQTTDVSLRNKLAGELRDKLIQTREYVSEVDEDAALTKASNSIESYFNSALQGIGNDKHLEDAFSALQQFVDINVRQAEGSLQESARWERMGGWIGISSGAFLLLGVMGMLLWLGLFAFRPVFETRDAMKAFGAGSKNVRAPEHGPEELRGIAAQFNGMAEALTRQQETQLSFLAAVAHDLKTPLSALNLSAQILMLEQAVPGGKLTNLMSVILRQIHQLDRMVGDLLDRCRIEGGQLKLRCIECDARKIAEDAFNLFSSTSTAHQFVLHLPQSAAPMHCDPFRIEQVLNNLISNAIKYSPDGGLIELSLTQERDGVQFLVADHGMGIPEHELPFIFEPFRRVRTLREDIPGVGLGLSVAQRIVQAHAGRIEAVSRVGEGTTFRVYLPTLQAVASRPL